MACRSEFVRRVRLHLADESALIFRRWCFDRAKAGVFAKSRVRCLLDID